MVAGEMTWHSEASKMPPSLFLATVVLVGLLGQGSTMNVSIELLVLLHGLAGKELGEPWMGVAAAGVMAVHHINQRNSSLVPDAASLLPSNFRLSADIRDSMSSPSVSIGHSLSWTGQGRNIVVGSYSSAVTGPVSLAVSVSNTPVLSWGSTSSSLADKSTYPTLSRVVPSDTVLSEDCIKFVHAMHWNCCPSH